MDNAAKELGHKIISQLERIIDALRLHGPRQNNPPAISDTRQATQKDNATGGKVLGVSQVDPSPHSADKAEQKWYRSFEWWKSRIEFVAIFAAIGYAVITYCQWHDANRNFRIDERAWVAPFQICEDGTGDLLTTLGQAGCAQVLQKDSQVIFKVLYKNTGRTFATNVSAGIVSAAVFDTRDLVQQKASAVTAALIAPDVVANISSDSKEIAALKQIGSGEIYTYGKIWYSDVFGGKHWTSFCFEHPSSDIRNAFRACPFFNDCDDCERGKQTHRPRQPATLKQR